MSSDCAHFINDSVNEKRKHDFNGKVPEPNNATLRVEITINCVNQT